MARINFFAKASITLASFLIISLSSFAQNRPLGTQQHNGPNGYFIDNITHLNTISDWVNNVVATGGWTSAGKTFTLRNNIGTTFSGFSNPIGTSIFPFMGTFEGNNWTVTLSMDIGSAAPRNLGMFGYTKNATIRNLTTTGTVSCISAGNHSFRAGGVVAVGENTTLLNLTNLADVTMQGYSGVGGIVGRLINGGSVTLCANAGTITLLTPPSTSSLGGICGEVFNNHIIFPPITTTFSRCINIGTVDGQNIHSSITGVGGICGSGNNLRFDNCGNYGWVRGLSNVGGILGSVSNLISMIRCLNTGVVHCITGGALIGSQISNPNAIEWCYYDNQMVQSGFQGVSKGLIPMI